MPDRHNTYTREARRFKPLMLRAVAENPPAAAQAVNKILVVPSSTADVQVYPKTAAGLTSALAAASSGWLVWVPPCTLAANYTIPAGVGLAAWGAQTVIQGQVTLNAGSWMHLITVERSTSSGSAIAGVVGPGSGTAILNNCHVNVTNTGAGNGYAVQGGAGAMILYNCWLEGYATGGGSGYAVLQSGGTIYITDDGRFQATTAKVSGTVTLVSQHDLIKLHTSTSILVYAPSSTGLTAALAATSSGNLIHLPPGTISGNHTIPAGVEVAGLGENVILSGTITNDGILTNIEVSGTLTNGAQGINRSVTTAAEHILWRIGRQGEGTTPPDYGLTSDGAGGYLLQRHRHNELVQFLTLVDRGTLKTIDELGNAEVVTPVIPVGHAAESDAFIREIGSVLYEADEATAKYKTVYTGYLTDNDTDEYIHYAYSEDGIAWRKYAGNPIIGTRQEDPYLLKVSSTYYIYAEDKATQGADGHIRRWSSADFETWADDGRVTGLSSNAASPVVWKEGSTWYMLYEDWPDNVPNDLNLATSSDGLAWTPDGSNPVFAVGDISWNDDAAVDAYVSPDDIVKIGSTYYMLFHTRTAGGGIGCGIATSTNLTTWTDSPNSPLTDEDGNQLDHIQFIADHADYQFFKFLYYLDDSSGIYRGYAVNDTNTLTIASGAVEIDKDYHIIAAESGTADDLATINGGVDYQLLVLQADSGDTITIKHGTGNVYLNGATDLTLSGEKSLVLFYDGTNWSDFDSGGAGADQLVKVSANDTTAGYLNGKLVAGAGIDFTENNDGGNETLTIASHYEVLMADGITPAEPLATETDDDWLYGE